MKAALRTNYKGPDSIQIQEIEKPFPSKTEILVKVHASTVNRTDCAILRAKPFIMRLFVGLYKPKNPMLGTDFAGEVEAVGDDVNSVKPGDRIFGFDDNGLSSHAEYLILNEKKAFGLIPKNISFEEAAASLEGLHYAVNFINKIQLQKGHSVLVNGATGAIGSATVQLVKYFGTHVTAVCKAEHFDIAKRLGADELIDYLEDDFTKHNKQFDFVLDTVGKSSFGKCKPILKSGGFYLSSELGWMAQNLFFSLFKAFTGSRKVIFPLPLNIQASIDFVCQLYEEKKFTPLIDRKYPLENLADAFRYVETGEKIGNVVVEISR